MRVAGETNVTQAPGRGLLYSHGFGNLFELGFAEAAQRGKGLECLQVQG